MSKSTTLSLPPPKPSSQPWTPHGYQKRAILWGLKRAAALFFLDPGMGKTSIILEIIRLIRRAKTGARKTLIIAPLRVCQLTWPDERDKWTQFNGARMVLLHGDKKDELLHTAADIYLINPEGLQWLTNAMVVTDAKKRKKVLLDVQAFRRLGFDTLVVDEISKFKNTASIRFKIMRWISPTFGRRWGLTGSPAANGLMGLFGECWVIDCGRTFGQFITNFRNTYFTLAFNGFDWNLQEGAAEKIYKRIKPLALRMDAKDYLKLPQLHTNPVQIDLPQKARDIYDKMEAHLIAQVGDRVVLANNAGVASGKCRQIASGGIYLEAEVQDLLKLKRGAQEWAHIHDAKTDALEDLVDELEGQPLLVAYDTHHDLDRIRKRFGKDLPFIGQGVSAKKVKEIEQAWNAGKIPLLAGHPQSIGHGLNFQGACQHVCWYSPTWDYELWDQFIKRVLRQGNPHKRVTNHVIIARDTIDDVIVAALGLKEDVQQSLFQYLKAKIRAAAKRK